MVSSEVFLSGKWNKKTKLIITQGKEKRQLNVNVDGNLQKEGFGKAIAKYKRAQTSQGEIAARGPWTIYSDG